MLLNYTYIYIWWYPSGRQEGFRIISLIYANAWIMEAIMSFGFSHDANGIKGIEKTERWKMEMITFVFFFLCLHICNLGR